MSKIYLEAIDVWDFFNDSWAGKELPNVRVEDILIAEDEDGVCIYLTDWHGYPKVIVEDMGEELYSEGAMNQLVFEEAIEAIYDKFLKPHVEITTHEELDELSADIISEREDELYEVFFNMLEAFTNCRSAKDFKDTYGDELLYDIMDRFCDVLSEEYNISVYRPTIYEDDAGNPVYDEYPYSTLNE